MCRTALARAAASQRVSRPREHTKISRLVTGENHREKTQRRGLWPTSAAQCLGCSAVTPGDKGQRGGCVRPGAAGTAPLPPLLRACGLPRSRERSPRPPVALPPGRNLHQPVAQPPELCSWAVCAHVCTCVYACMCVRASVLLPAHAGLPLPDRGKDGLASEACPVENGGTRAAREGPAAALIQGLGSGLLGRPGGRAAQGLETGRCGDADDDRMEQGLEEQRRPQGPWLWFQV